MEPFKNLTFDFNRVLLQLLIPGVTAIFPYFIFLHLKFNHFNLSDSILVTIIFLSSIAAGLILEDIGSNIEQQLWEKLKKDKLETDKLNSEWYQYLNLTFEDGKTPIIIRYIRTLAIRLKFELSFGVAILIMSIGLHYLNYYHNYFNSWLKLGLFGVAFPLAFALYCFYEANESVKLLATVRSELLKDQRGKLEIVSL